MTELHLVWTAAGKVARGFEPAEAAWRDEVFSHGPLFPGLVTEWKTIFLTSSCIYDQSQFTLTDLRLFVDADEGTLATIRALAETIHGIQVSFDDGATYICLTDKPALVGPGAFVSNPGRTELRPFDTAKFKFRISIPDNFTFTGKLSYRIGADFDAL